MARTGAGPAAAAKVAFQYKRAGTTTWKPQSTVTAAKSLTWASSTSKALTSHVRAVLRGAVPATLDQPKSYPQAVDGSGARPARTGAGAESGRARPRHAAVVAGALAGLSFAYGAYLVVLADTPW
ncbi:hypothetical protein [Streptomyces canus]|uniref:hypothetical protein n=1 Tax=Streptomyces canus TaxID=58343 RepID=UPI00035C711F|nr:hypothetical protein [Streptomyces canus]